MLRHAAVALAIASATACSTGAGGTPSASAPSTGTFTLGSYHSDPAERAGMDAINAAFSQATGSTVAMNTVDHNTFQNQITAYLGGRPDDAFTWFSGYRMRFLANQGLASPIDDVWAGVKGNFTDALRRAATGDDGKVYGIPVYYYPWAVFYRKSVFTEHGYQVPGTWDELLALATRMQADGLVPLAFGNQDGWPAMGTFDMLNLRLNGYQFHVDLLAGREQWTDPRVTAVFAKWRELVPFQDGAYAGLKWQLAADKLVRRTAGMFMLGLFASQQFTNPDDLADLDFFPFPTLGTPYDEERAVEAPVNVVMLSSRSATLAQNLATAKAWLAFYARGSTQKLFFDHAPGFLPAAMDAETSDYSPLQKKAVELVSQAGRLTQFLDRDTRPDFAGTNGMQSFLQRFLRDPNQDVSALQAEMQRFWDSLPPAV
jgi:multiple sugar transport system substrate-binding protein